MSDGKYDEEVRRAIMDRSHKKLDKAYAELADTPRIKKRSGPSPTILRKGGPMKDKTKYNRKEKYSDKARDIS